MTTRTLKLALLAVVAVAAAAPVAAQTVTPPSHYRDLRYCEILLDYPNGQSLRQDVYNTPGLNYCPEQEWRALDADTVAAENGAIAAFLNGPRHFTMDLVDAGGATVGGQIKNFGGIEMQQRATSTASRLSVMAYAPKPYQPKTISRTTTYTFLAGKPYYQLTDQAGNVYIMQAYSQNVDPTLTMGQLPTLGSRLKLPKGWSYAEQVPSQDLQLVADGQATVLNDDLQNVYQRR